VGDRPLRIGAFAPLTRPGLVPAGRQLKAGLELGIEEVNRAGGVDGRLLELLMRDSAGLADRATAALQDLDGERVVALAGEFHSVVARRPAELADSRGLPVRLLLGDA
jgi:ABC-type branched-subunit amino acid transport system substrate-binding protein